MMIGILVMSLLLCPLAYSQGDSASSASSQGDGLYECERFAEPFTLACEKCRVSTDADKAGQKQALYDCLQSIFLSGDLNGDGLWSKDEHKAEMCTFHKCEDNFRAVLTVTKVWEYLAAVSLQSGEVEGAPRDASARMSLDDWVTWMANGISDETLPNFEEYMDLVFLYMNPNGDKIINLEDGDLYSLCDHHLRRDRYNYRAFITCMNTFPSFTPWLECNRDGMITRDEMLTATTAGIRAWRDALKNKNKEQSSSDDDDDK